MVKSSSTRRCMYAGNFQRYPEADMAKAAGTATPICLLPPRQSPTLQVRLHRNNPGMSTAHWTPHSHYRRRQAYRNSSSHVDPASRQVVRNLHSWYVCSTLSVYLGTRRTARYPHHTAHMSSVEQPFSYTRHTERQSFYPLLSRVPLPSFDLLSIRQRLGVFRSLKFTQ